MYVSGSMTGVDQLMILLLYLCSLLTKVISFSKSTVLSEANIGAGADVNADKWNGHIFCLIYTKTLWMMKVKLQYASPYEVVL